MLMLIRGKGERIRIDNRVVVQVLEIRDDRVRLGIECPVDVPVVRDELCRRLRDPQDSDAPDTKADESPYFSEFA